MTPEEYEAEENEPYDIELLKDLRTSVRSIDSKVEDILDEIREHLPVRSENGNSWHVDDLYDDENNATY